MLVVKVPLRISLVGGGTDFPDFYKEYGGSVVSMAIDKYVYVIVKERFDDLIVLNYTQHEIVEGVDDIKHDLIRECMKYYNIEKGIEISTLADIPSKGSGLGSSSAITVALCCAFANYLGKPQSTDIYAKIACEIEIDILNNPTGKQDQFACAYGGFNFISFGKNNVYVCPYGKDTYSITDNLFLHYTGVTRRSSDILTEQKRNINSNLGTLLKIKSLAEDTEEQLYIGNYDNVGKNIGMAWEHKKELSSNITTPQIDEMIYAAYCNHATGCKLLGAGAGGFILSYVTPDRRALFQNAMKDYRELKFNIDPYGARVIFNIQ